MRLMLLSISYHSNHVTELIVFAMFYMEYTVLKAIGIHHLMGKVLLDKHHQSLQEESTFEGSIWCVDSTQRS